MNLELDGNDLDKDTNNASTTDELTNENVDENEENAFTDYEEYVEEIEYDNQSDSKLSSSGQNIEKIQLNKDNYDKDVVLHIPFDNIEKLIEECETVQVPVHGTLLTLLRSSVEKYGIDCGDIDALNILSSSLEDVISPKETLDLRRKQIFSQKTGTKFIIERGNLIPSADSLKLLVPNLCTKIEVEILNKEMDISNLRLLNTIKDEYVGESHGLKRVLKSVAAAEILNLVQEEENSKELEFYFKILTKFKDDTATKNFVLNTLRQTMQFALNVDTLELKSILTKELLNNEQ